MNIRGDRTQVGSLSRADGTTKAWRPETYRHHQERHRSSTIKRRASRRHTSTGTTRRSASRRGRMATHTRRSGPTSSSSACRTSRSFPATRTRLGGPHRRDRRWDRDHRRRLILDRPAAVQRAVRRPGLLRDQGRQDRRHAQGRRVSDAHAGVLGSMDMIGGPKQLSPRRRQQRRQRPTRAEQRRVSHGCVPVRASAISTSSTRDGPREPLIRLARRARCSPPRCHISRDRVRGDRQESVVVRDRRRDARHRHQHARRQHALRRESDFHAAATTSIIVVTVGSDVRQTHRRASTTNSARRRFAQGRRRDAPSRSRSSRPKIRKRCPSSARKPITGRATGATRRRRSMPASRAAAVNAHHVDREGTRSRLDGLHRGDRGAQSPSRITKDCSPTVEATAVRAHDDRAHAPTARAPAGPARHTNDWSARSIRPTRVARGGQGAPSVNPGRDRAGSLHCRPRADRRWQSRAAHRRRAQRARRGRRPQLFLEARRRNKIGMKVSTNA